MRDVIVDMIMPFVGKDNWVENVTGTLVDS
jgi:hypothetical protein